MGKKVIVIGGGIIGLCTAYYLQKEGHHVTVIDKSQMNSGASYVNAGYLTPSHIIPLAAPGMISKGIRYMFDSSSPFYMKPRLEYDFLKWAWAFKKSSTAKKVERAIPHIRDINLFSRDLFDEIKASGELGQFHYERKGLLMYYQTQKEGDHEIKTAQRAAEMGLQSDVLDAEGIKKVEKGIEINALGAVHYHCDAHTTPTVLMQKLQGYLPKVGVKIIKECEVSDFEFSGGRILAVTTQDYHYEADEIVLAAGSWSSNLSKKLGLKILLQAGKGYRIDVADETGITMPAILLDAKMAVTPMQGYTRFAGTMEFSGINNTIRKERVEAIAKGAASFFNGLNINTADKNNAQCGLRPVSPDGLPYIGRIPSISNLILATGHAMMGWSLGPATGKLVSQLISEKKPTLDISPYNPVRRF